jgi:hypothetical protein
MYRLLLCSLLALSTFGAEAANNPDAEVFSPEKGLDPSVSFEAQRSAILAALNDGKTYSEISNEHSRQVRVSLDRISELLAGKATAADLHGGAQVEAFNEQELVNSLLTKAHDDSRLVCRREKRTGSNRYTSECATVAERRRARDDAYLAMKEMRHSETLPPPGAR